MMETLGDESLFFMTDKGLFEYKGDVVRRIGGDLSVDWEQWDYSKDME
jgi:hypothetical protein